MTPWRDWLERINKRYGGQQPLAGYTAAMGVFGAAVAVTGLSARLAGRPVPPVSAGDVVLMTAATHELARIISKDAVTSPLRAPLVEFDEAAGASEVNEHVTASGPQHALGELLTCPFCLSVWISAALCGGLVFAPRATRLVAAGLTAVAGANFLQLAYDRAKKAAGNTGH
jgi:hypothetical protein